MACGTLLKPIQNVSVYAVSGQPSALVACIWTSLIFQTYTDVPYQISCLECCKQQTTNCVVDTYTLTKFEGGLHEAEDNASSWMATTALVK